MQKIRSLRETALFFFAVTVVLLTLRSFPILADDAVSLDPKELHFAGADPSYQAKAPKEHVRPMDQTFLTYPEWFLVFSPAELADFLKAGSPTDFPFLGHIIQFWQGYASVSKIIAQRYPFNFGYHVMIMVIGTSTTFEYAVKGLYENSVGRLTGLFGHATEEDAFYADYQANYVRFIRDKPWYLFDFGAELKRLYSEVSFIGGNPIRKIERRLFLTNELVAKYLYGKLIGVATQSAYETPLEQTAVWLKKGSGEGELVMLPRYEAFMKAAVPLAREGAEFHEVAGNPGPIVVSVVGPKADRAKLAEYDLVLTQPIPTQSPLERFVVALPMKDLGPFLSRFGDGKFYVEHVYDY